MNIKIIRNRFPLLKGVRRLEAMLELLALRNDFEFTIEQAWGFKSPSKADLAYKSRPEDFFKGNLPKDFQTNGWQQLAMDIRRLRKLRETEEGGSPELADEAKQQLIRAIREIRNS